MAKKKQKQPSKFTREQSMESRPIATEILERKPLENGGQRISVEVATSPWRQRLLRMPAKLKRQFELDAFGVQVLEMCDGQKPVKHIIDRLVREHKLDPRETERAVTMFLRMLMRKGIVTLYLPKHKA